MRDKTKKGVFAVFLAAVTMAFAGIGISGTAARADDISSCPKRNNERNADR